MANATAAAHERPSELAKLSKYYIPVLDGVSLSLCLLVSFALYKSRDKWRARTGSYVEMTFVLVLVNMLKSGQLLLYRYIEKGGDSASCAVQGFMLIFTEIFQQLCILVLAAECTFILTYALSQARFVKNASYVPWCMRRCIAKPSVRFTCYVAALSTITIVNCILLQLLYGFGSDQKHPKICNFKLNQGPSWDPDILIYHWVTFFTPVASIMLGLFLIVYIHCKGYQSKYATTSGVWKLAFIPTIYFALQTPFLLDQVFFVPVPFSIMRIAGHSMPGMLALCIWYQNSYARNYIKTQVCDNCCALGKANKMSLGNDSRSLQMEDSFRESLIASSSFDEDDYETRERLKTSAESILGTSMESMENLEVDFEDVASL